MQQETTPISGGTIAYAYDALGRAVFSTVVGGSGGETFQYDALGRLSAHGSDLGSFTFTYLGQTGQITQHGVDGRLNERGLGARRPSA